MIWRNLFRFLLVLAGSLPTVAIAQKAGEPIEMYLPLPAESRAIGEHGVVEIEGGIGVDGRLTDSKIVSSSRSERLDQLALTRLGHARVSQEIISRGDSRLRLIARFYAWDVNDLGKSYACSQAVIDYDWYASVFPDGPEERSPLRALIWSAGIMAVKGSPVHLDNAALDRAWVAAVAACRNDGTALFLPTVWEKARTEPRSK